MDIFFDKFNFRSEAYKLRGVEMLKQIHQFIFTEEFILQNIAAVHRLLNFYKDFIYTLPAEKKL